LKNLETVIFLFISYGSEANWKSTGWEIFEPVSEDVSGKK
jgi:hypothetical protein